MVVIPDLTDIRSPSISAVPSRVRGVIPGSRAAHIRHRAEPARQRALHILQRVRRHVGRPDPAGREPAERRQALVEQDGRVEEVNGVFVALVLGAVARHVEGGEARGVLAELVRPELGVGSALVDPVRIHIGQQVVAAEVFNEGVDARAGVRWHGDQGAIGASSGGGRGPRIILATASRVRGAQSSHRCGTRTRDRNTG